MSSTLSLKKPAMTLEQRRSQAAWSYAQEGVARSDQYKDLAKAAPALIMNNGLMQTLAFYEDKNKPHHQALASQLRRWIMLHAGGADTDPGFQNFMSIMLKADSSSYRQATEEALLLLRWIRQFAAALGG
jgi:CRISPR-associated protein Cmr5